ncbi:hypothetical protein Acsp06_21530 [Actinomycetospora sp. NBRC 106375]|uniref:DUF6802 family protein n=1 Tax=Actinomycetospora sp. NBRC 106375 TaxID=3032207 RepID=UPI0024A0A323|nr:DUF6802 family protein [Actinomycetospora sp. NBRC 106375]GLZ45968.1 hypothetical protein Acsp06_21530 [Actinomycetospora sp. NBRC 106375]
MVELDPGLHPDTHVDPGAPAELLVTAADGAHPLGPPTVDSDADGRADTAVVPGPDTLVLGTDLDGDGHVDVLTQVHEDGSATTAELPEPGPALGDGGPWDEGPAPPPPTIDPVTGGWVRDG